MACGGVLPEGHNESMKRLNFDYNATTPIRPEVVEAMIACWKSEFGNPASQHELGRRAERRLQEAREHIVELLGGSVRGTQPDRLIFTSGGTESNNLAVLGIASARAVWRDVHVVVSAIEHPSVLRAAEHILDLGGRFDTLSVTPQGVVDLDRLEVFLKPDTRLVSVMVANHEIGTIQPVRQIAEVCRRHGIACHTDAVQAVGKVPVRFADLGVDAMSIAAHKFHGPVGVGALLVRADVPMTPRLFGGEQQWGLRPGTESVALAVGMEKALELAMGELESEQARLTKLRERFETGLKQRVPAAIVHGETAPRLPQTVNVAFPGLDAQVLFAAFDLAGISCSVGSACASGAAEASATLAAMQLAKEEVRGSVRFSFGRETSEDMIDDAVDRIARVVGRLK
ncbi:cysteine desulfurase NifS [Thermostilla marina]